MTFSGPIPPNAQPVSTPTPHTHFRVTPLTMFMSHVPPGVQDKWRPWIQLSLFLFSSLISKDIPGYFAGHSKWPLHWNVCFSRAALIMPGYRITGWSWRTCEFLHTYLFTCLIPATLISSSTCNDLHSLTQLKMHIFARTSLHIKQFILEVTYE